MNKNASFIYLEENTQYEDLIKIVSEDFSVKEEEICLSYGISLDFKCIVEGFSPVSIANTRQLRSFVGKIIAFGGISRLCVKVITDSASFNKQTTASFASPIPMNDIPDFGYNVQREKQAITDSTSFNKQTTASFASPFPMNDIPVFGSSLQSEKQTITDSTNFNKQFTASFVSHVLLNAIPVFGSSMQSEKQTLPCQGVSAVPLNPLPDLSLVYIRLPQS